MFLNDEINDLTVLRYVERRYVAFGFWRGDSV